MFHANVIICIRKSALWLSQIILLLAFGCGPAPTPIIFELSTPTQPPATATQPSVTQPGITPVPSITPTPPETGAVIKIFTNVPLSGDQATAGQDILHGAELAVAQLSGPLKELGYRVELVSYDDQNLTEVALANAQAIVADPEILCGVGHLDPQITITASDVYHQAGLPFVAPAVTAPLLTDRNYLEVNRVIGHTDGQGFAAAQFALDQGYSSLYIVSQRSAAGLQNAEHFRTESGRLGIKRLGSAITSINEQNIDQIVNEIVNLNPELVYVSSSASQAVPLFTKLRAAGYMGAFLGTERLDSRSGITSAGPSLIEGGGLYYTITNPPATYYPEATKFVEDFNARFEGSPRALAARAYDATGVCLKALEEASRPQAGNPPTRGEVARAIRDLLEYPGITGTYTFNSQGDPSPARYYVYQVASTDPANWDQNPIVAAYDVTPP